MTRRCAARQGAHGFCCSRVRPASRPALPANERAFTKAIRIYLEGHHGRRQLKQRPHDDLKANPSIFV